MQPRYRKTKVVQFVRVTSPFGNIAASYQPGDVAGFDEPLADWLLSEGHAKAYPSPLDKQSNGASEHARGIAPHEKQPRNNGKFAPKAPTNHQPEQPDAG